ARDALVAAARTYRGARSGHDGGAGGAVASGERSVRRTFGCARAAVERGRDGPRTAAAAPVGRRRAEGRPAAPAQEEEAPQALTSAPDLRSFIRDIPDFPSPGIVFKAITP